MSYLLECKNRAAFVHRTLGSIALKCNAVVACFLPYPPVHILCRQWAVQSQSEYTKAHDRFYKWNLHLAWIESWSSIKEKRRESVALLSESLGFQRWGS